MKNRISGHQFVVSSFFSGPLPLGVSSADQCAFGGGGGGGGDITGLPVGFGAGPLLAIYFTNFGANGFTGFFPLDLAGSGSGLTAFTPH